MFSRRISWAQRREGAVGSQGRGVGVGVFSMGVVVLFSRKS